MPVRCTAKVEQVRSLMEMVRAEVKEFRRDQALAYPIAGMICLLVMAAAHGVIRGPEDLAGYADTLSQAQLRALGFRRNRDTGDIRCPKKTTFTRLLHQVDDDALERVLLAWQDQILGPQQDRIVIFDGKKIRHGGVEIVNAADSTGRFLGSVITASKSNEIPAARHLLLKVDLLGKITIADAIHTQDETVRQIFFEQGGDYLLTVKLNQPTLHHTLESLFAKQSFSPSAHGANPCAPAGAQPGPAGDTFAGLPGSHACSGEFSRSPAGRPLGDTSQA